MPDPRESAAWERVGVITRVDLRRDVDSANSAAQTEADGVAALSVEAPREAVASAGDV